MDFSKQHYFLPSEIDRLIVGYLQEKKCNRTLSAFFNESKNLGEFWSLLKQGHIPSTTIAGLGLVQILNEYCHLKINAIKNSNATHVNVITVTSSQALGNLASSSPVASISRKSTETRRKKKGQQGSSDVTEPIVQAVYRSNESAYPTHQRNHPDGLPGQNEPVQLANQVQEVPLATIPCSALVVSHRASTESGAGTSSLKENNLQSELNLLEKLLEEPQFPEILAENINKALHSSTSTSDLASNRAGIEGNIGHTVVNPLQDLEISTIVDDLKEHDPSFQKFLKLFNSAPTISDSFDVQAVHIPDETSQLQSDSHQAPHLAIENGPNKVSGIQSFRPSNTAVFSAHPSVESSSEIRNDALDASTRHSTPSRLDNTNLKTPMSRPYSKLSLRKKKRLESMFNSAANSSISSTAGSDKNIVCQDSSCKELDRISSGNSNQSENISVNNRGDGLEHDKSITNDLLRPDAPVNCAGDTNTVSVSTDAPCDNTKPSEDRIDHDESSLTLFSLIEKRTAEALGEKFVHRSQRTNVSDSRCHKQVSSGNKESDIHKDSDSSQHSLGHVSETSRGPDESEDMSSKVETLDSAVNCVCSEPEQPCSHCIQRLKSGAVNSDVLEVQNSPVAAHGGTDLTSPMLQANVNMIGDSVVEILAQKFRRNINSQLERVSHQNMQPEAGEEENNEENVQQSRTQERSDELVNRSNMQETKTSFSKVCIGSDKEKETDCKSSVISTTEPNSELSDVDVMSTSPTYSHEGNCSLLLKDQVVHTGYESHESNISSSAAQKSSPLLSDDELNSSHYLRLRRVSRLTRRSGQSSVEDCCNTMMSPPRVVTGSKHTSDSNSPRKLADALDTTCKSLPASLANIEPSQRPPVKTPCEKSPVYTTGEPHRSGTLLRCPSNSSLSGKRIGKTVISVISEQAPFTPAHYKKTPSRRIAPTEVSYMTPSPLQDFPSSPMSFVIDLPPSQPPTPATPGLPKAENSNQGESRLLPPPGQLESRGLMLPPSPSQRKPKRVQPKHLLLKPSTVLKKVEDDSKTVTSTSDHPETPPTEEEALRLLKSFLSTSYSKPQPPQAISSSCNKLRQPPGRRGKCGCLLRSRCKHQKGKRVVPVPLHLRESRPSNEDKGPSSPVSSSNSGGSFIPVGIMETRSKTDCNEDEVDSYEGSSKDLPSEICNTAGAKVNEKSIVSEDPEVHGEQTSRGVSAKIDENVVQHIEFTDVKTTAQSDKQIKQLDNTVEEPAMSNSCHTSHEKEHIMTSNIPTTQDGSAVVKSAEKKDSGQLSHITEAVETSVCEQRQNLNEALINSPALSTNIPRTECEINTASSQATSFFNSTAQALSSTTRQAITSNYSYSPATTYSQFAKGAVGQNAALYTDVAYKSDAASVVSDIHLGVPSSPVATPYLSNSRSVTAQSSHKFSASATNMSEPTSFTSLLNMNNSEFWATSAVEEPNLPVSISGAIRVVNNIDPSISPVKTYTELKPYEQNTKDDLTEIAESLGIKIYDQFSVKTQEPQKSQTEQIMSSVSGVMHGPGLSETQQVESPQVYVSQTSSKKKESSIPKRASELPLLPKLNGGDIDKYQKINKLQEFSGSHGFKKIVPQMSPRIMSGSPCLPVQVFQSDTMSPIIVLPPSFNLADLVLPPASDPVPHHSSSVTTTPQHAPGTPVTPTVEVAKKGGQLVKSRVAKTRSSSTKHQTPSPITPVSRRQSKSTRRKSRASVSASPKSPASRTVSKDRKEIPSTPYRSCDQIDSVNSKKSTRIVVTDFSDIEQATDSEQGKNNDNLMETRSVENDNSGVEKVDDEETFVDLRGPTPEYLPEWSDEDKGKEEDETDTEVLVDGRGDVSHKTHVTADVLSPLRKVGIRRMRHEEETSDVPPPEMDKSVLNKKQGTPNLSLRNTLKAHISKSGSPIKSLTTIVCSQQQNTKQQNQTSDKVARSRSRHKSPKSKAGTKGSNNKGQITQKNYVGSIKSDASDSEPDSNKQKPKTPVKTSRSRSSYRSPKSKAETKSLTEKEQTTQRNSIEIFEFDASESEPDSHNQKPKTPVKISRSRSRQGTPKSATTALDYSKKKEMPTERKPVEPNQLIKSSDKNVSKGSVKKPAKLEATCEKEPKARRRSVQSNKSDGDASSETDFKENQVKNQTGKIHHTPKIRIGTDSGNLKLDFMGRVTSNKKERSKSEWKKVLQESEEESSEDELDFDEAVEGITHCVTGKTVEVQTDYTSGETILLSEAMMNEMFMSPFTRNVRGSASITPNSSQRTSRNREKKKTNMSSVSNISSRLNLCSDQQHESNENKSDKVDGSSSAVNKDEKEGVVNSTVVSEKGLNFSASSDGQKSQVIKNDEGKEVRENESDGKSVGVFKDKEKRLTVSDLVSSVASSEDQTSQQMKHSGVKKDKEKKWMDGSVVCDESLRSTVNSNNRKFHEDRKSEIESNSSVVNKEKRMIDSNRVSKETFKSKSNFNNSQSLEMKISDGNRKDRDENSANTPSSLSKQTSSKLSDKFDQEMPWDLSCHNKKADLETEGLNLPKGESISLNSKGKEHHQQEISESKNQKGSNTSTEIISVGRKFTEPMESEARDRVGSMERRRRKRKIGSSFELYNADGVRTENTSVNSESQFKPVDQVLIINKAKDRSDEVEGNNIENMETDNMEGTEDAAVWKKKKRRKLDCVPRGEEEEKTNSSCIVFKNGIDRIVDGEEDISEANNSDIVKDSSRNVVSGKERKRKKSGKKHSASFENVKVMSCISFENDKVDEGKEGVADQCENKSDKQGIAAVTEETENKDKRKKRRLSLKSENANLDVREVNTSSKSTELNEMLIVEKNELNSSKAENAANEFVTEESNEMEKSNERTKLATLIKPNTSLDAENVINSPQPGNMAVVTDLKETENNTTVNKVIKPENNVAVARLEKSRKKRVRKIGSSFDICIKPYSLIPAMKDDQDKDFKNTKPTLNQNIKGKLSESVVSSKSKKHKNRRASGEHKTSEVNAPSNSCGEKSNAPEQREPDLVETESQSAETSAAVMALRMCMGEEITQDIPPSGVVDQINQSHIRTGESVHGTQAFKLPVTNQEMIREQECVSYTENEADNQKSDTVIKESHRVKKSLQPSWTLSHSPLKNLPPKKRLSSEALYQTYEELQGNKDEPKMNIDEKELQKEEPKIKQLHGQNVDQSFKGELPKETIDSHRSSPDLFSQSECSTNSQTFEAMSQQPSSGHGSENSQGSILPLSGTVALAEMTNTPAESEATPLQPSSSAASQSNSKLLNESISAEPKSHDENIQIHSSQSGTISNTQAPTFTQPSTQTPVTSMDNGNSHPVYTNDGIDSPVQSDDCPTQTFTQSTVHTPDHTVLTQSSQSQSLKKNLSKKKISKLLKLLHKSPKDPN